MGAEVLMAVPGPLESVDETVNDALSTHFTRYINSYNDVLSAFERLVSPFNQTTLGISAISIYQRERSVGCKNSSQATME